ncbi:^E4, partial [Gammapapillomavirus 7]
DIKIPLFLLLLSPAPVAPPGTPHPNRAPTPWDKKPPNRRASADRDLLPPVPPDILDRVRGKATGTPARRRLEYRPDDDEEKENQQPNGENDPQEQHHLGWLLKRWGEDIDLLKEKVSRDLDNYKKTLGIPPSFY